MDVSIRVVPKWFDTNIVFETKFNFGRYRAEGLAKDNGFFA